MIVDISARRSNARPPRVFAVALLCATLASCSSAVPGDSSPAPAVGVPSSALPHGDTALDGWKLTLPTASAKGTAASVNPATIAPPWLTRDGSGNLVFFAPVVGVTTPNSEHARTELDSLANFTAGSDRRTLGATIAVTQVPSNGQDVIIGQIHGAGDISSAPFVMVHYQAGAVYVVVKQKQTGSSMNKVDLLSSVPLGTGFAIGVSDEGNGQLTFTASSGSEQAHETVPVPAAWQGATVRFQAGAYQLDDSTVATSATTSADDGAKVVFSALTATSS